MCDSKKENKFDADSFVSGIMLGGMFVGATIAALKVWHDEKKMMRDMRDEARQAARDTEELLRDAARRDAGIDDN